MKNNKITKDIIGIAVSGQVYSELSVSYFFKEFEKTELIEFPQKDILMPLVNIKRQYLKCKYGDSISPESLKRELTNLNKVFNNGNKVPYSNRSLFFSGIMIALHNKHFRSTYEKTEAPSSRHNKNEKVIEAENLNNSLITAIDEELSEKTSNLSKKIYWKDSFSFIKNIDYSLDEYKKIIKAIETKIYIPFENDENQDVLGSAYKIFLSRAGKAEDKNIILTPDHIKRLMIRLANLKPDDVVLDTCTGSGGFLMAAMETMLSLAKDDSTKEKIRTERLIGFEIDPTLFALACSNMFLHGDGRTNLVFRSSLLDDNLVNSTDEECYNEIRSKKPTKVIINPPYERNQPIKFTIQALKYLENNGKLVIIMPTETLIKNQAEGGLTEQVLKVATLNSVIKMPDNLFSEQNRTISTSIFIFTKTPHQKENKILFYNLYDDGFETIQHKGRIDTHEKWDSIEHEIVEAITYSTEKYGISKLQTIYDSNNKLNCTPPSFSVKTKYELVKIDELFFVDNGTLASEKNTNGDYPFITADKIWKTHEKYALETEAIVYAVGASGSLGRSHYINGKFTASNLCLVLTNKNNPKYPINLKFYNYYFKSIKERIKSDPNLVGGNSKRTINKNKFKNYRIEYIPYNVQLNFVKKLDQFLQLQEQYFRAESHIKKDMDLIIGLMD